MQDTNIGRQYTFENFEVTKANSRAFEAAKRFAENTASKPLALFGAAATGKTHLLYAVRNHIKDNHPELNIILTRAAQMKSSLFEILHNGGTADQFREKYTRADILLVDNIQDIAGKKDIQLELIRIFDHFFESGKPFMMTSSQKAAGYGISDRLVIRSFWGDFAVITQPYIHAGFEIDRERKDKRSALIRESEILYRHISHDKEFTTEAFKSYFKEVWDYFSRYIGLFDIDREDVKIICYLNRMDILLNCKQLSCINESEQEACMLFLKGLIYTLSSYDIEMYSGGFYGNGVLFIPLPHQAGTPDCLEFTSDEFDEWFDRYCNGIDL